MMWSRALIFSSFVLLFCAQSTATPAQAAPLNANVSGFGTSFIFGPTPICKGCFETELGLTTLGSSRYIPAVLTLAPLGSNTDITLLANVLESVVAPEGRKNRFGDRIDLVIRHKAWARGGLVVSVAPKATVFLRDTDGGRLGTVLAGQYGAGRNTSVVNLALTKRVESSTSPQLDYQLAFDYTRLLARSGTAVFAGIQHAASTGNPTTIATEGGVILPFRNGQLELATQQLDITRGSTWMFQARVIANLGRFF